jgi:hypothetical protein
MKNKQKEWHHATKPLKENKCLVRRLLFISIFLFIEHRFREKSLYFFHEKLEEKNKNKKFGRVFFFFFY